MYHVAVATEARRDIVEMVDWLASRNPAVAVRVSSDLQQIALRDLELFPKRFAYFWLTGSPFRGRLFQVSQNTKYWLVYVVDEDVRRVDLLRVWNASRNPAAFEL